MSEDRFIIDGFEYWSFSRLSSFHQCKREWHENYILHPGENDGGAFAEYGSLQHEIFEKYKKQELGIWDCLQYYEDHYQDFVLHDFPQIGKTDLNQSYYEEGINYWSNFDGLLENHKVLGVEKEVKFDISGYKFIGYIDLLTEDENGDLVLTDHKSKKLKILKSGKISKTDLDAYDKLKKQLYLYSKPIIEEYDKTPKWLQWNLFRLDTVLTIPFDEEEYQQSLDWAIDTIHEIEEEELWLPNKDFFYCRNLCGARERCWQDYDDGEEE